MSILLSHNPYIVSSILSIQSITKFYRSVRALHEVSFEVPQGSVFGILGPNGSGKTTLLGIVMDVLRATSGTYSWFGQPPSEKQRQKIGTLLETPNFYHYLSGEKNLQIAAAIKGRGRDDIGRVLEIVKLADRKNSKFSTYSLGMKQRLAIASCLLGDPSVLVFDEPTNGLDPEGIAYTRELIRDLARQGKTIVLASHLLDEVEKVCTHVAILRKGQLLTAGSVHEALADEDYIELGTSADTLAQLRTALAALPGIRQIKELEGHLQLSFDKNVRMTPAQINKHCFDHDIVLDHLLLGKKSLESKFMDLTK